MAAAPRADYGIDAPAVVRRLVVLGASALAIAAAGAFREAFLILAAWLFVCAATMLAGSRFGKLRLRDTLLARIPWRGDEHVLDVGCGRGLMLIGAAHRLTTGRAVGVDVWRAADQSDNRPETTLINARLEGVADTVDVRSGDARNLPFGDASFDVVLSSFALHNIENGEERAAAVREILRVLKPGGHVGIVDVWRISQYRRVLRDARMDGVRLSAPSFWFVVPSFILTATKPH
jgi:SAM-dependent methyltransferase